jgi:hypothetical protein
MTNRTSNMPGTEDILGHSERQTRRLIPRANDPAGEPIWEHIRRPWWVRLINAVGGGLRRFGVRWPRLDAGTLLANRLSPGLAIAPEVAAESPEEANYLFARDLQSVMFETVFDVPEYTCWLRRRDLGPSYNYARRQLQFLSWKYRADHWVLKTPAHLSWLGELLDAFPNASVIVTHRDPLQVVPSWCSLMAGLRRIANERLDLHRLGAQCAEELAWRSERMIAARAAIDPARFLDVSYERMVADPISTIREACRHFGYDLTPEFEARARRYIAEYPRHKHGVHRYCLKDFGLDEATVNHQFADYRYWLAGRTRITFAMDMP